jgi:hypothetical protein
MNMIRLSNVTLRDMFKLSKGMVLLFSFYIPVTVGSSTMSITHTLKWVWNDLLTCSILLPIHVHVCNNLSIYISYCHNGINYILLILNSDKCIFSLTRPRNSNIRFRYNIIIGLLTLSLGLITFKPLQWCNNYCTHIEYGNHWLYPKLGQTNDYTIGICCGVMVSMLASSAVV